MAANVKICISSLFRVKIKLIYSHVSRDDFSEMEKSLFKVDIIIIDSYLDQLHLT